MQTFMRARCIWRCTMTVLPSPYGLARRRSRRDITTAAAARCSGDAARPLRCSSMRRRPIFCPMAAAARQGHLSHLPESITFMRSLRAAVGRRCSTLPLPGGWSRSGWLAARRAAKRFETSLRRSLQPGSESQRQERSAQVGHFIEYGRWIWRYCMDGDMGACNRLPRQGTTAFGILGPRLQQGRLYIYS
jgi:hypothetical protein